MNMKEELTTLFNKYASSTTKENAENVLKAIDKWNKYITRLNLEAQGYFDKLMVILHETKE